MDDYRLSWRKLESVRQRRPKGKEKKWMDHVPKYVGVFGIAGDWSTAVQNPEV